MEPKDLRGEKQEVPCTAFVEVHEGQFVGAGEDVGVHRKGRDPHPALEVQIPQPASDVHRRCEGPV